MSFRELGSTEVAIWCSYSVSVYRLIIQAKSFIMHIRITNYRLPTLCVICGKRVCKIPSNKKRKTETTNEAAKINNHAEAILQASIDGFCVLDIDGKIVEVNPAYCAISGYSKEELVGKHLSVIEANETPEQISEHLHKAIKEGYCRFETQHRSKDGSILYIDVSKQLYDNGKKRFIFAFYRDITEHKKTEEALQLERSKLVAILDSMEDGIYIVDQDENIQYVNPVLKKEFGEPESRKCYEFFHDRKEICPWCKNKDVFAGKTVRWEWYSFKNQKTYDLIDTPLRNPDGSISKLEIFRDITERKKTEEALRESENRYKTLFQGAVEGVLIADIETKKFKLANPAICRMLGYTEKEMKRMHVYDIHPKENLEYVLSEFEAQAQMKKTLAPSIPCLRKDGTTIYVDIKTTKAVIDERECNVGFFTDITEHKRIKTELENYKDKVLNAQKHAYIASMGAIVAHQLNQPLTTINMRLGKALEMLQTKENCSPVVLKNIEKSLSEAKKTASIIREFRQHSKDFALETTGKIAISSIANRIISMLFEKAEKAKMNISARNLEELPEVEINEMALEQIFLIIIQNAIEATDGKGIGLGLDIVQQILISCGGEIRVESVLGKGTTFYVTLPISNNVKS